MQCWWTVACAAGGVPPLAARSPCLRSHGVEVQIMMLVPSPLATGAGVRNLMMWTVQHARTLRARQLPRARVENHCYVTSPGTCRVQ